MADEVNMDEAQVGSNGQEGNSDSEMEDEN